VHADDRSADDAAKKLELLRERISGLKSELVSMRGKRDRLQEKLEKSEKDIGEVRAHCIGSSARPLLQTPVYANSGSSPI